jgi:predicted permease
MMPKAMQKTLLKLGLAGFLMLLVFNYPLLSLYRGTIGFWPVLYIGLFGVWFGVILIARRVAELPATAIFRSKQDQSAP